MKCRMQFETDDPLIIEFLDGHHKATRVVEILKWWTRLGGTLQSIDNRLAELEKRLANQTIEVRKPPEVPPERLEGGDSTDDDADLVYRLIEMGENFGKKR